MNSNIKISLNIRNCASIVHGALVFEFSNTRMIPENLKSFLLHGTSPYTMDDKKNSMRPALQNGNLKVMGSFLDSQASKVNCVLWRSHSWPKGSIFFGFVFLQCRSLLESPLLLQHDSVSIMQKKILASKKRNGRIWQRNEFSLRDFLKGNRNNVTSTCLQLRVMPRDALWSR